MSNTPIPPIGLGPQSPAPAPGQVVQIVSIPDALRNAARTVRVEGEVIQQNKDGSTRIRTPQGDMDVQVRGRQPQPGQKVELDIAAGNPPRTATMRPAPQAPAQPAPLPQTPPATGQPVPQPNIPLPQTPVTRPAPLPPVQSGQPLPQTPVPVDASGKPLPPLPTSYPAPSKPVVQPAPGMPAPPLTTGQIVRLTPVMPSQIQQLQTMTPGIAAPDAMISTQVTSTVFQAGLIARGARDSLQKSLIQILKSALVPTPAVQQQNTPSAVGKTPAPFPAPVTQQPQAGTQQTIKNILSAIFAPAPTDTGGIKIASTLPMMPSLTGLASLENTITPAMPAMRPLMLDARILEIRLPQVQILSTPGNANQPATITRTDTLSSAIKLPADVLSGGAKPTGIIATVTGFTPQNLPLINIQWPNTTVPQNYILQFAAGNLETGSQLVLLPQPSSVAMASVSAAGLKPLMPLLQASMIWPPLDDLFQAFLQTSPQIAQSFGKIIPSPANPTQLGPAALLFVAAARAGDLQNWMGDKRIEALQKIGKQSLLSRLNGELSSLSATSTDTPAGEWRSLPVPMLWQNEISKIMLHVHHDRGPNQQNEDDSGTRFIFDLALTRMGDVQLDGLLRGKRLDLIIRTQVPISDSMQQAMRLAYANALNGTEIYGELSFQGDLKNWMHVIKREETFGASA